MLNTVMTEYISRKLNLKYVMFDESKGTASIVVDDADLVEIPMEIFFKLFIEKDSIAYEAEAEQEKFLDAQKYLRNLIGTMKGNGYGPEEIIDYIFNTVQLKDENLADYKDFIKKTVAQHFDAA